MLRDNKKKVRPVRVVEIRRQAYSGYWVAFMSDGTMFGVDGEDELDAWRRAQTIYNNGKGLYGQDKE